MIKYPKMHTIFKRNDKGQLIFNEWTQPEFKYLANNKWIPSEKIDGTNIRIFWEYEKTELTIGGRTENSQIPTFLFKKLTEIFIPDEFLKLFPTTDVCLYGEGFGEKIQTTGSLYLNNEVNFILFDVLIGKWWLKREDVKGIAENLNIKAIPELEPMTLREAIEQVCSGFISKCTKEAEENKLIAEGLVLRPSVELKNRKGDRIITKIKHRDFKNYDNNSSEKI